MEHARPGWGLSDTVLAYVSITEKYRIGAEQTIIMQSLNYRQTLGLRCIVTGWRDKGKSIVKVNRLGPLRANELAQLAVGCSIPDCGAG
jgi:hypothetical protein